MSNKPSNWNAIFEQEGLGFVDPHEDMPQFVQALIARSAAQGS
jgi:hypothetical protein